MPIDQTLPPNASRRSALLLAALSAALVFLFHIAANLWQTHLGYGYFRDEMYYLMCGRHLAWGYVDHGPMVALQSRIAETVFGRSLTGIRLLAGLAGALRIFLTGLLTWQLGGRRAAQMLAMIAVAVAPQYLGGDGYLSMNSWESVFWMTCLVALIQIAKGSSDRLWLLFGIAAGLGLLNKPSMTFFLVALLIALVVTPQRRLLATPWMLAGVALMLTIVAPYIVWQMQNHWPTWEFLQNGRAEHKNVILSPLAFFNAQFLGMHPLNALVYISGLIWLLRRANWRWLGVMYLVFLAIMMTLHAKDYYVVPIYPILFAAGGLAWQTWRPRRQDSLFGFPILEAALLVTGAIILPMSTPIMTPPTWLAYTKATHLYDKSSNTENTATSELPQFYADRFGWQEEVDQVERVYASLTPDEKKHATLLTSNYGDASALNFLGHGIPVAISGHNNYWLWGTQGETGEVLILIERTSVEHLQNYYTDVQVVGNLKTKYAMPFEQRETIFLLRGPRQSFASLWPEHKDYF